MNVPSEEVTGLLDWQRNLGGGHDRDELCEYHGDACDGLRDGDDDSGGECGATVQHVMVGADSERYDGSDDQHDSCTMMTGCGADGCGGHNG